MKNIKFTGCKFTLDGLDTSEAKNTNPLWLAPINGQILTVDNCTIVGNRPIKYSDDQPENGGAKGTLNVTNCTFTLAMGAWDTAAYDAATNDAGRTKVESRLTAVRIGTDNAVDKIVVGEIKNNTMISGYAFYQTDHAPYSNESYDDAGNDNTKPDTALWCVEY